MELSNTSGSVYKKLQKQRWLTVVIDVSEAMAQIELPPNRLLRLCALLPSFIYAFFEQNPLSQLQIISTSDGMATMVSNMSGNPDQHIKALRNMISQPQQFKLYQGTMSIQNSLICGLSTQKTLPRYGKREILMLVGTLVTWDSASPAGKPLHACLVSGTSISFIHLAAELQICKHLSSETGGVMAVPLDEKHLCKILLEYASFGVSLIPVPDAIQKMALKRKETSTDGELDTDQQQHKLMVLGFPFTVQQVGTMQEGSDSSELIRTFVDTPNSSYFMQQEHFSNTSASTESSLVLGSVSTTRGSAETSIDQQQSDDPQYCCPRCMTWLSSSAFPMNCPTCRLLLVKFSQLSRSYHHIYAHPKYIPLNESDFNNLASALELSVEMMGTSTARIPTCSGCYVPLQFSASTSSDSPKPLVTTNITKVQQPSNTNVSGGSSNATTASTSGPLQQSPFDKSLSKATTYHTNAPFKCDKCQVTFCWTCVELLQTFISYCPNCLTPASQSSYSKS